MAGSKRTCRCGHSEAFHEHYRAGSECSHVVCQCRKFHRSRHIFRKGGSDVR